jgi:hypothetical protein
MVGASYHHMLDVLQNAMELYMFAPVKLVNVGDYFHLVKFFLLLDYTN